MVTQKDLDKGLEKLRVDLTRDITDSIKSVQDTVIAQLLDANEKLRDKVDQLEKKVILLESAQHDGEQYSRQNNLVISGIPKEVVHDNLEGVVINIINRCNNPVTITNRDIEACHRTSQRSDDVVCRLVNRKDVEEAL